VTTSLDSVDLLGDLVHARRRPRFVRSVVKRPAWPASTPERVEREVPPPEPAPIVARPAPSRDWMDAPAWPGTEPSPVPPASPTLRSPGPTLTAVVQKEATPAPAVPRDLAVAAISPRLEAEESVEPPLERAFGPAELELDPVSAAWFVEGTLDPFLDGKPEGRMPWWALAIPGVAAAAMIALVIALMAAANAAGL